MGNHIYTVFTDRDRAWQGATALLEGGARAADVSLVIQQSAFFDASAEAAEQPGLRALAAHGSMRRPGFGLVLGGGPLASALMQSASSGAVSAEVAEFLRHQGCGERAALDYSSALAGGNILLAVAHPSGKLAAHEIQALLVRYKGTRLRTFETAGPGLR